MGSSNKPAGLTKDTGWQVGLRRTIPFPAEVVWQVLLSTAGIKTWLGNGKPFVLKEGATYQLTDGTDGEVRVYSPLSHIRITRFPPDPEYRRASTIQIRVLSKENKSTLVFHEEHLPNQEARQSRKLFYLKAVEQIEDLLENS
jgi:uncharacterized protein YndB with AHSA1/START domain